MADASVNNEVNSLDASAAEVPETHTSKTDQIAELLRRPQPDAEQAPEVGPSAEDQPAEKWDVASVAERLQVDAAKLYDLEIPLADGEKLRLGDLKDRLKAQTAFESERQAHVQERGNFKADEIRAQRELEQLLAGIPRDQIKPELVQAWEGQQRERFSREQEALFRKVPEWSDPERRAQDKGRLEKAAGDYGFSPAELGQVLDHRFLVMLRDLAQLKAATSKTPAAPEPKRGIRPRASQAPSPAQDFGRLKQAVTKGQLSKTAAIGKLLRQG